MFNGKTALISLLTFSGFVRLLGFGLLLYVYFSYSFFSFTSLAGLSLSFFYSVFPFFGVFAALKERYCGLKLFSIFQTIFVILFVISTVGLVVAKFVYPQSISDKLADPTSTISLQKFEGSIPLHNVPQPQSLHTTGTSKGCLFSVNMIIVLSFSFVMTIIDIVSAVLAFKGYKQLSTPSPISTSSYVPDNVLELNELPVMVPQPQPLNVVYIPLGESVQTGRPPLYV